MARALALWWISGGPYGLLSLATHYCGESIAAAWRDGMAAVAELPEWSEVLERNPVNRERFLAQDPQEFIATLEQWMRPTAPGPTSSSRGWATTSCVASTCRPWCSAAG